MSTGNRNRFPVFDSELEAMKFAAARAKAEIGSIRGALGDLELRSRKVVEAAEGMNERKYKEIGKIYEIGLAVACDEKLRAELDKMLAEAKIKFTRDTSVFSKVQRLRPTGKAVSRALTSHDALAMREAARRGLSPRCFTKGLLNGGFTINKLAASFREWFNEEYPDHAARYDQERKIVIGADSVKISASLKPRHHRRLVRYNRHGRSAILVTVDVTDPVRPFTVEVSAEKSSTSDRLEASDKSEVPPTHRRHITRKERQKRRAIRRRFRR